MVGLAAALGLGAGFPAKSSLSQWSSQPFHLLKATVKNHVKGNTDKLRVVNKHKKEYPADVKCVFLNGRPRLAICVLHSNFRPSRIVLELQAFSANLEIM